MRPPSSRCTFLSPCYHRGRLNKYELRASVWHRRKCNLVRLRSRLPVRLNLSSANRPDDHRFDSRQGEKRTLCRAARVTALERKFLLASAGPVHSPPHSEMNRPLRVAMEERGAVDDLRRTRRQMEKEHCALRLVLRRSRPPFRQSKRIQLAPFVVEAMFRRREPVVCMSERQSSVDGTTDRV